MKNDLQETINAAEAGDVLAQLLLGLFFISKATEDHEKAVYWFKKAAKGGNEEAKYKLAVLCYEENLIEHQKEAFKWLCQIAEEEYPGAQHLLGLYYETGFGTPKNHEEAQKWFELADDNGYEEEMAPEESFKKITILLACLEREFYRRSCGGVQSQDLDFVTQAQHEIAKAQYDLGLLHYRGLGTPVNKEKAVELYREAAEKGHASAMFELACCHANGEGGLKESKKESAKWLEKAAEKGHAEALFLLGCYHESGFGMQKDIKKAIEYYKKSAENGCKEAQCLLGGFYYEGKNVPRNFKKAFELLEKAAKQNHPEALFMLAVCYEFGRGVAKSQDESLNCLTKSADLGGVLAKAILGGRNFEKDPQKAAEFWNKAAQKGHADSLLWLGMCYMNGEGVPKNTQTAFELWKKAAEQGSEQTQMLVANCYNVGECVAKDATKAFEWFVRAEKQGNAEASFWVSVCYAIGNGVPQNSRKAVLNLAKNRPDVSVDEAVEYIYYFSQNLKAWINKNLIKKIEIHAKENPLKLSKFKNILKKLGIGCDDKKKYSLNHNDVKKIFDFYSKDVPPIEHFTRLLCKKREKAVDKEFIGFYRSSEKKKYPLYYLFAAVEANLNTIAHGLTRSDSTYASNLIALMSNESNRHKGMLLFYITEAVKEGKIKKIQETENSDGDYSLNILEVFNFFTQKDMEFHINPLELEVLMTSAEKRELFSDWANLQLCKKRHSYLHVLSGIVLLVETAYEIYRDGGQNNFSDKFRKFLDGFSRKNIDYSCWEFVNEQIKNADQEVMTLVKPYIENWDILREDIIEILEKLKEKGEGDSSQKAAVFCRWYGMVCFLAFNEFVAPSDEGQSVTLKELIQFPTNYLKKGLFWGVELREVKEDTFYGNLSKLCSKGDFPFYKASKARTAPFLFDPDEKHKINLFHEEMGFLRRKSDDDKTSSKKEKKSNSQNKSKPEKK